ncbi:uncharacterized protein K441DRAFT_667157, partial [Cenococcum geophilum 1.58]|uniref:uncharacterized protein n=1 Tax=Cenococcum geophilum 1.58 TaxID=794803 RepID=UPI00358FAE6B
ESIIPTIAKGDEGHNDQDDVDPDDRGVYRIDQQLKGGVETEAAQPKKIFYTAVACSSYAYIQPTPPEPHLRAPYKIKIPRRLKEPLQPKDYYADIKLRKDIERGRIKLHHIPSMDQPADGLTKAHQRTSIRRSKKVPPKSPGPSRPPRPD